MSTPVLSFLHLLSGRAVLRVGTKHLMLTKGGPRSQALHPIAPLAQLQCGRKPVSHCFSSHVLSPRGFPDFRSERPRGPGLLALGECTAVHLPIPGHWARHEIVALRSQSHFRFTGTVLGPRIQPCDRQNKTKVGLSFSSPVLGPPDTGSAETWH